MDDSYDHMHLFVLVHEIYHQIKLTVGALVPLCAVRVVQHAEIMVYELPEVNITDCNSHNQCKNRCTNEGYVTLFQFNEMTNNMDLWSTVNGETVGHYICQNLYGNFIFFIHNSYVHAYYEMCGGPWEYANLDSQQMLCCNVGQPSTCSAV
ncbi:uncharacterized protein LOC119576981 [Penaeus monodon]|uniref:uncharacterized protein LOC119576981 n=1 Tax=Penaeus monodon TaxID=6687 RepID=UPI0018A7121B|nr:uncharacterized protein LOC119576981 [Penaeus monodon]